MNVPSEVAEAISLINEDEQKRYDQMTGEGAKNA
jgi:hypothetical protein